MGRQYNFIYKELVKSDDDLIGLIAYGIYKKHKIEFIEQIQDKFDREPTDEECSAFFITSTTDSQIVKYRNDAESLLSDVVANTSAEELESFEEEMLASYQANIRQCLPPWWHNVLWSVIASFIFSALGIFFYYLGVTERQSTPQQIELKIGKDSINVIPQTSSH